MLVGPIVSKELDTVIGRQPFVRSEDSSESIHFCPAKKELSTSDNAEKLKKEQFLGHGKPPTNITVIEAQTGKTT